MTGSGGNPDCTINTVEIPTEADAYLDLAEPDVNFGSDARLYVVRNTQIGVRRTLLRFDLEGGVPEGATLLEAEIVMTGGAAAQDGTLDAHRVVSPWEESSVSWDEAADGTAWQTPGGDFDADLSASLYIADDVQTLRWEVLPDVQRLLESQVENHGWLLKDAEESSSDSDHYFSFDSRTSTLSSTRPRMRLRYCFDCERCL